MADEEIIDLVINARNLSSDELAEASDEVEKLGRTVSKTESELDKLLVSQSVINSFRELQTEIKQLKTNLASAEVEYDKSRASLRKNKEATDEERAAVKRQNIELKSQRALLSTRTRELDKVRVSLKKLGVNTRDAGREEERYAAKIKQTQATLKQSQNAYKQEAVELRKLFNAKKKVIEQQTAEQIQTEKTNKVYKDAANDRVAQINREIKAAKKLQQEREKQAQKDASVAARQKATTANLKKYEVELKKLHAELRKGNITKAQYITGEDKLRRQLNLTEKQVKATNKALAADTQGMNKKARATDALTKVTRRLAQAYTVLLAAQKASQAVTESVKGYSELESAQVKVEKTTNLMKDQLVEMTDVLQTLATDVTPTAVTELLRYAEVAGQLGAEGSEDILRLASAADTLNVSTDLAGDEAVKLLTRILTMTKEGVPAIDGLASSIVELGNSTATSESEIVQMTKEIVTGTTAINLGSTAAAGYGATLKELGQTGERSRSTFTRLSNAIKEAVLNGGDDLETLQNISGQTADELEKNLAERPEAIITDFIEGLSRLRAEGTTTSSVLKGFGITATESVTVLDALANNTNRLQRNLKLASDAQQAGNRHIIEAAKAYATQEASISRLINRFTELKADIGEAFSDETNDFVNDFGRTIDENRQTIIGFMETIADVGEELLELGQSVGEVGQAVASMVGITGTVGDAFDIFKAGLNTITGSIKLAIGGILEFQIQWLEFINTMPGNVDAYVGEIQRLKDSQDRLFAGVKNDFNDVEDAVADFHGTSSDAFRDLIRTSNTYREAVSKLSEKQQAQLQEVTKAGAFNSELNETYRKLTSSIIANNRQIEIEARLKERQQQLDEKAVASKKELERVQAEQLQRVEALVKSVVDQESTLVEIREASEQALAKKIITEGDHAKLLDDLIIAESKLAEATEASRLEVENSVGTYENASTAVIDLKDAIAEQQKELIELTKITDDSTRSVLEKEKAERDIALTQRELVKNQQELNFLNELEGANVFKLTQLRNQLNLELQRLNQLKQTGVAIDEAFLEKEKQLETQLKILNDRIGESTTAVKENTKSIADNTSVTEQNTEAKGRQAEKEGEITDAVSLHIAVQQRLKEKLDFSSLSTEELVEKTRQLEQGFKRLTLLSDGTWWDDVIRTNNAAIRREQAAIEQTINLRRWLDEVRAGTLDMEQLQIRGESAVATFNLLGDEQLKPLRSSIEAAQREFEKLDQTISSSFQRTEDRLDALLGKEGDILARRFTRELQSAEDLLEQAKGSGNIEIIKRAEQNVTNLKKAQQIETNRFKAEQKAEAEAKRESEREAKEQLRLEKQQRQEAESQALLAEQQQDLGGDQGENEITPNISPLVVPVVQSPSQGQVSSGGVITINLIFNNTGRQRRVDVANKESADSLLDTLNDIATNNLVGVN